jgi:hypothetical protein
VAHQAKEEGKGVGVIDQYLSLVSPSPRDQKMKTRPLDKNGGDSETIQMTMTARMVTGLLGESFSFLIELIS